MSIEQLETPPATGNIVDALEFFRSRCATAGVEKKWMNFVEQTTKDVPKDVEVRLMLNVCEINMRSTKTNQEKQAPAYRVAIYPYNPDQTLSAEYLAERTRLLVVENKKIIEILERIIQPPGKPS